MKRAPAPKRIAILGCGAVGRAFAKDLASRSGREGRVPFRGELAIWSRSRRSVGRCLAAVSVRDAKRMHVATTPREAVAHADIVLLCVVEKALPSLVRATRRAVEAQTKKPVLLLVSGFQDLTPLRRELGPGMALGRFHPLAPVPPWPPGFGKPNFGIEGDARARRSARALLPHWDSAALELRPGGAPAYHAGAALLGGGIVALFALAEASMARTVRSRRGLRDGLKWFAVMNAVHAGVFGPEKALTGPVARGADAAVRLHLRALRSAPREAYRVLGETMLDLARARGSIDAATERRLRRILKRPARGR